jgi:uncharacterized RDD family membrane protein YckC
MKTKITEIKENYTVNRPTKNSTGERVYEEKSFTRYKDVNTVTGWARFGHYALDVIFYYIFAMILAVPIVIILMTLGMDVENLGEGSGWYNILDRLISWLVLYPGYYILFESTMQSTPGKIILGRVVVDEYGEKPSFLTIVKRSYSRVVPFEAFSCLSNLGWHDTWSDTFVIRKKDLEELKLAIKAQEFGQES